MKLQIELTYGTDYIYTVSNVEFTKTGISGRYVVLNSNMNPCNGFFRFDKIKSYTVIDEKEEKEKVLKQTSVDLGCHLANLLEDDDDDLTEREITVIVDFVKEMFEFKYNEVLKNG